MREATWAALSDPNRRSVLGLLRSRPHAVGELVTALGLSQPATSKHLRVLREAGLVRVVPDAQRRIYALDPAHSPSWTTGSRPTARCGTTASTRSAGTSTTPRRPDMHLASDFGSYIEHDGRPAVR